MNHHTRIVASGALALALGIGTMTTSHSEASGKSLSAHKTMTRKILATTVNSAYVFAPRTATIKVGTRVTWVNKSDAPHTVTGNGTWHFNKQFDTNKSVSFTFTKPGKYTYYCAIHPFMKATIIVQK